MATSEAFERAYATLTLPQKKAVDTVEGPVLVIAGPGTGKTHVLTLRIANILLKTHAKPGNILVLTFTESAARTVRKRLGQLVGDAVARDVFIATFHGFAEYLLHELPQYFPKLAKRRLMGDVENTLLWRSVLETEEVVHLRTPKSPFHYLKDLSMLQRDLVREHVSLSQYREWIDEEAERIRSDESLRYVRGEKQGEMKPDGVKKLERLEKAYEAARLIEAYEALKITNDVYDFGDVLTEVVAAIDEDHSLQSLIQETYQYVLADEHQDANPVQHALLNALAFDDYPNLFVVGDEKQAIYRFQGADAGGFEEFAERYPRAEIIPLTESFRSFQGILDEAQRLADTRMPKENGGHPKLEATRKGTARLQILRAQDPLAERDQVAYIIEEAIREGTAPHDIAVIASRNATADMLYEHLRARGIPTLRAGDIALDSRPLIRAILALMRTVTDPLDRASYREMLLAPWWKASLVDRAALLQRSRDSELVAALTALDPKIPEVIDTLREDALRLPPLEAFSRLMELSGARGYILSHSEHIEDDVVLVRRLMMHIEEEVARDTSALLRDVVASLTKAGEHGLSSVKSSVLEREGHVTVITAHKAKGMEFKVVFIVGLTANEWEKGGRTALIPSPIDMRRTMDDVFRQFYVALTRAKDEVIITHALESWDGKERAPSLLIPDDLPEIAVSSDPLPLLHSSAKAPEVVRTLTRAYLKEEGLSPSALKEYLESPACFFARRVLRLKEPESPAITIGNAVHAGIAAYLETKDTSAAHAALETSLRNSLLPRNSAFEHLARDARSRLEAYVSHTSTLSEVIAVEKVYATRIPSIADEVLLKGKVDAVFESSRGICIVDFKTSSTIRAHDEEYRHQLAFYDLLLRAEGMEAGHAMIVQVSADEVTEHPVPLTDETRNDFTALLAQVIDELLRGEWRKGEPSAYDDLLALF